MQKLLLKMLLFYSSTLPYHRGKWQLVEFLLGALGLRRLVESSEVDAVRNGIRWRLKPGCLVQRSVYLLGVYEVNETNWVLDQVRDDWRVLDIGSNFGYYSMLIASRAPGAKIYAFEPHSGSFGALQHHCRANDYRQVKPQRLALSDAPGSLRLVIPPSVNEGIGHLDTGAAPASGARVEEISALPLDTFVAEHKLDKVDFIKIDVEGAELLVLGGAEETITRWRPRMLIEVNPLALERFGRSAAELLERIRSFGYDTYRIRGRQLEALSDPDSIEDYVNVACVPTA